MKSSIKKQKKNVSILTPIQSHVYNSTIDLIDDDQLIKMPPKLKKYQSSQFSEDNNIQINDDSVYQVFYRFLDRLTQDHNFCLSLLKSVQFQQLSKRDPASSSKSQSQKIQKAAQKVVQKSTQIQRYHGSRRLSKKVSIFIDFSQNQSSSSSSMGSSKIFITKNSIISLSQVSLPNLQLNPQLIKDIFIAPSLYLMNLSLCLLLKYSYYTNTSLDKQNIGWILGISAIVAYKIYYDQQIEDLIQCFQDVMKVNKRAIVNLQRNFLEGLDYRAIISGPQYQYVVAKMLQNQKENIQNRA